MSVSISELIARGDQALEVMDERFDALKERVDEILPSLDAMDVDEKVRAVALTTRLVGLLESLGEEIGQVRVDTPAEVFALLDDTFMALERVVMFLRLRRGRARA